MTPFSGSGNKLGSASTSTPSSSSSTSQSSSSSNILPIKVDESQPTTSIQIRCGDGSRLIGKFNHTHTIKDIRQFIDSSKGSRSNYDLWFSFPQKLISDEGQTIAAAGLVNSMVIQKLK